MKEKSTLRKFSKVFILTTGLGFIILLGLCVGACWGRTGNLSDVGIDSMSLNLSSKVMYLDSSGQEIELENLFAEQHRVWVDYNKIPTALKKATIAIEDQRFYQHKGFDLKRTAGAMFSVVKAKFTGKGSYYGGSTITQQLIKNLTGEKQNTVTRKLNEILRAVMYEKNYSKDQILELYLNTIYLSQGCNGVQAGAKTYFDKSVSDLSLAQCASLIGITQLPAKYDPLINPEANKEKQKIVLQKMLQLDFITKDEYDEALAEPLVFLKNNSPVGTVHSYFVDQVINDVISALKKKGYSEVIANKMLFAGGLKIVSSYNPKIQKAIDKVYSDINNFPKQTGELKPQSAFVVINNSTGAVCGVAGGLGPKTASRTLNRATQSLRQPGSTIKPIAIYAPALDAGIIKPSSVYNDRPVTYQGFTPQNYDRQYRGEVTVQYAVEHSLNTIPVQILSEMGIDRAFNCLTSKFGITSLVVQRVEKGKMNTDKGLAPLALGGLTDGVSPLELTAAYAALANKGNYIKPYFFTEVYDNSGRLIVKVPRERHRAIKETTANTVSQLLNAVVTRGTAVGAQLADGICTCGKTGTTSDNNDKWFVGYTAYYTATAWYGYDQPRSLGAISNPCIPVFRKIMNDIHRGLPIKNFITAEAQTANICMDCGKLATELCHRDERGDRVINSSFASEASLPTEYCDCHVCVDIDKLSNMKATQCCPQQNIIQKIIVNNSNEYEQPCSLHPVIQSAPNDGNTFNPAPVASSEPYTKTNESPITQTVSPSPSTTARQTSPSTPIIQQPVR